eukprot:295677_1
MSVRSDKSESPDAQMVLGITHLIITCIELAICVYCAYQLYQNWHEMYMKKRRHILVLFIFICSCYSILFEYPHFTILKFFPYVNYWTPPHVIIYAFASFPRWSQLILMTLRIYLLHFDHEYERLLKTHKWKILINENAMDENWYFQNRLTYGSGIWIIKHRLFIPLLIFYIFYLILWFVGRYPLDITISMLHALTLLFSIIVTIFSVIYAVKYWKKFPKFMDNLNIRNELKIIIIYLATAFILGFIIAPFSVFRFYSSAANIFYLIVLSVIHISVCITLTIYPKRKYFQYLNSSGQVQFIKNWERSHSIRNTDFTSWEKIVHMNEGYESWANFLEKEFSIENLMFITEYVMVKQLMMKDAKLQEFLKDINLSYELELHESLMNNSSLAKQYQKNGNFMETAKALFLKYINPRTATLEINLPFAISQNLRNTFKILEIKEISNDDIKLIMRLLDDSAVAISKLMNDSFLRFKYTETFDKLIKHIQELKNEKNEKNEKGIQLTNSDQFKTHAQVDSHGKVILIPSFSLHNKKYLE